MSTLRRVDWPMLAIVATGAALRFATLDVQSFWLDEVLTVEIVRGPLADVISTIAEGEDATPPLYFLLVGAWSKVFGSGEVGLRSFSALVGTATIVVAYFGARTLIS